MSEQGFSIPECLGSMVEIGVALDANSEAVPSEASSAGRRVYHTCHEVVAAATIKVAVAAEVWVDVSSDASKAEPKPQAAKRRAAATIAVE